jgi:hypothetical protein
VTAVISILRSARDATAPGDVVVIHWSVARRQDDAPRIDEATCAVRGLSSVQGIEVFAFFDLVPLT